MTEEANEDDSKHTLQSRKNQSLTKKHKERMFQHQFKAYQSGTIKVNKINLKIQPNLEILNILRQAGTNH